MPFVQDGFVFRLTVGFQHEIVLYKKQVSANGTQRLCDNEKSSRLEYCYLTLPQLTSSLHGLVKSLVRRPSAVEGTPTDASIVLTFACDLEKELSPF